MNQDDRAVIAALDALERADLAPTLPTDEMRVERLQWFVKENERLQKALDALDKSDSEWRNAYFKERGKVEAIRQQLKRLLEDTK